MEIPVALESQVPFIVTSIYAFEADFSLLGYDVLKCTCVRSIE